jgi:hypothetical protein
MALDPNSKTAQILQKIGLVPKHTEVSMFLTTITMIILSLFNKEFLEQFVLNHFSDIRLAIIFSVFMVASIYFAFSKRTCSGFIAVLMAISMSLMNFFIALQGFFFLLNAEKGSLWMIFPGLNLISAFTLLLLIRIKVINEKNIISTKQAKSHELIIGSVAVIIIFVLSQFLFKNYWAITFSICLTYAGLANEILTKIFFREVRTSKEV